MSITSNQCRAGRAILGWTQFQLGERAWGTKYVKAHAITKVSKLERGELINPILLGEIVAAMRKAGVAFTSSGGILGVLLRQNTGPKLGDGRATS